MFTIQCDTGKPVTIDADSLVAACLDGLDLHRAKLDHQDLSDASLRGADLRAALLEGAKLWRCCLDDARMYVVWGIRGSFRDASCRRAPMRGAELREADFTGADLSEADLSNADLRGAIFTNANMTGATFVDARYDENTIWPTGFDPRSHGAQFVSQKSSQQKADAPAEEVPIRERPLDRIRVLGLWHTLVQPMLGSTLRWATFFGALAILGWWMDKRIDGTTLTIVAVSAIAAGTLKALAQLLTERTLVLRSDGEVAVIVRAQCEIRQPLTEFENVNIVEHGKELVEIGTYLPR